MKKLGKGCLVISILVFALPLALGATLYFAGPWLVQREVKSPDLTPSQLSEAETKINLPPDASQDTLILNVTELNALVQRGMLEDKSIKQGTVTIKNGSLALEASLILPTNSADFPVLLRGFSGKEVGVYLELIPSMHNDDVYVSVGKASIGKIPLPIKTLLSLFPQEWLGSASYTERGININELVGPDVRITDIKITDQDVQINYKTE